MGKNEPAEWEDDKGGDMISDDQRIKEAIRCLETAMEALNKAKGMPHCTQKKALIYDAKSDITFASQALESLRDRR